MWEARASLLEDEDHKEREASSQVTHRYSCVSPGELSERTTKYLLSITHCVEALYELSHLIFMIMRNNNMIWGWFVILTKLTDTPLFCFCIPHNGCSLRKT